MPHFDTDLLILEGTEKVDDYIGYEEHVYAGFKDDKRGACGVNESYTERHIGGRIEQEDSYNQIPIRFKLGLWVDDAALLPDIDFLFLLAFIGGGPIEVDFVVEVAKFGKNVRSSLGLDKKLMPQVSDSERFLFLI